MPIPHRPQSPIASGRITAPSPAGAEGGDTRRRLIESALNTFAEHGVEAVSIRTITAAAGQGNQTAVHYHFGDKNGLVAAVLEEIAGWLAPLQQEALDELANNPAASASVRDVVRLIFAPLITLHATHPHGVAAIRFMSRLTWQSGGPGQALLLGSLQPYFVRYRDTWHRLMPDKPPEAIAFHIYLAANSVLHGLADVSLLGQGPVPDVQELYPQHMDRLREYFYDYVAGGISAPVLTPAQPLKPKAGGKGRRVPRKK